MVNLKIDTFAVGSVSANCSIIWCPNTMEAIAIDPGDDAETFLDYVEKKGLHIKYLLHTHAHFDHIGHSAKIREVLGTPIYLHKDDEIVYKHIAQQGAMFGIDIPGPGKIDHLFSDNESLGINDTDLKDILKVIHTPGHTPGGCSFYSEAFDRPVLFSGDTLFQGSIGRTDFPGGDQRALMNSIKERLYVLPPETRVITGHGPDTTIGQEMRSNFFVRA